MLLREALGNSRNIPALRVLAEVGVEPALRFLESAGVKDIRYEPDRYGLGLAIGNLPVTLEELARLYGALAREGESLPLRRFVDEPPVAPKRLLHRETAQLVRHILADPQARRPRFPVGGPLDFPYAVAMKTGTSQGYRDAWAVAFSDRLLVAVWVGNHDWRRMRGVGGANGAAVAAHRIMDAVMAGHRPWQPILDVFPPPEGAVAVEVCPLSGRLASVDCPHRKSEWFFPGSTPTERCPFHTQVKLDRRNGLRAGPACSASEVITRVMLDLPDTYTQWARSQHLDISRRGRRARCARAARSPCRRRWRSASRADGAAALRSGHAGLVLDAAPGGGGDAEHGAHRVAVDGVPVATVPYPHEYRWSVTPGGTSSPRRCPGTRR